MKTFFKLLGSLKIAVPLLIAIAAVLGWGTIYETRFGTAAVQRFIYRSGWFQSLLAFLAVNLAVAAFQRYPWKRRHIPFVLAHLGIILVLAGGIIGGRLGIEGQMIIPEGEATNLLQLPGNVLAVHLPNPGVYQIFQTQFESTAWNHEPNEVFSIAEEGRFLTLTVDRYYPNSTVEEEVLEEGTEENPAVHVVLSESHRQEEGIWLFARDPDRFGVRWGEAHLLFLEANTPQEMNQLAGNPAPAGSPRGTLFVRLHGEKKEREIPVPEQINRPVPLKGTPYQVTFKDYFSDFAITERGPVNRSDQPNNPAVAFTLSGPEGIDPHLLFAFHPEFHALHGRDPKIPAQVRYAHPASSVLPPDTIALVRTPEKKLIAVLTSQEGNRQTVSPLQAGKRYEHPGLGVGFEVTAVSPQARILRRFINRDDEVKAEAIHLVAKEGPNTAEAWLPLRAGQELRPGGHVVHAEYRPASAELPFTVKLRDFRRIDYPGIEMAAGFESDLEVTDPEQGLVLTRTIRMNNPLKYRGYTLFQSSYIQGPVETTVLSVRNDPGTPLVYAGFIIIVLGVITMFVSRPGSSPEQTEGNS